MTDGQREFGFRSLIETLCAKVAMPRHPGILDDPVEAFGVIRAEHVPGSFVWGRIRFDFFHLTLLSAPRPNLVRSGKK